MTVLYKGRKLRPRTTQGPTRHKTGWNVPHPDGNAYFAEMENAQQFHEKCNASINAGHAPPPIPPRSERLAKRGGPKLTGVYANGRGWLVNRGRGKVHFADHEKAVAYRRQVLAAKDQRNPLPPVPTEADRLWYPQRANKGPVE